ncbi:exonuclease domain-containing protein [Brevundimonas sp. DC300-4]|uniref:exonuclease domain-containing protein n=1 Tax=Brevundimonas sp. DC300-4 TaxID=2804594 RepID=UPI003CF4ECDA
MGWADRLAKAVFGSIPSAAPIEAVAPFEADFVVVDVETACSRVSSICQIGIVAFRHGAPTLEFETLIDPRDEFDDFNISIHGITDRHVRDRPHFGALHSVVEGYLSGRVTVAHSSFDRRALSAACLKHGRSDISTRWVDSVQMARRAWPDLGSHKLNLLTRHLGIPHTHHDALSDARAAGMVVVRALEVTGLSLDELAAPVARQPRSSGPVARQGGAEGPLTDQCIVMTGDFTVPKSAMADLIAAAGGAVTSTVSRKTTMLVLGVQDSTTFAGKDKSAKHLKAEELAAAGQLLRIVTEVELRTMIG